MQRRTNTRTHTRHTHKIKAINQAPSKVDPWSGQACQQAPLLGFAIALMTVLIRERIKVLVIGVRVFADIKPCDIRHMPVHSASRSELRSAGHVQYSLDETSYVHPNL